MDDVDIAMKIYRPNIGMLKGKTIRGKYPQAKKEYIDLAMEQSPNIISKITLLMDTMSVNGCLFLTTISLDIYYQSAHFVKKQNCQ